jgi:peptidoglycan/xylan/chitin deacetylase (PgdA/CDA1 family)
VVLKLRILLPLFGCALLLGGSWVLAADCGPQALGVRRNLELGTEGGIAVGLKTYPGTLVLEDREIVLTFDDGPVKRTTAKVLDALAAECVKATFFMIGRNAEALPSLVRRAVAEGHTIAHHTYSHPARTLRGLDGEAARREIERGIAAVERAAYGFAGSVPRVPFFRYPGFADTEALNGWLAARNIGVIGTDLWASDWLPMTPEAELALILGRIEKEGRGIVLLHDIKAQTAAMLPAFLRALKERGFAIVHLVTGQGAAPTRPAPPGWRPVTEPEKPKKSAAGPAPRKL